MCEYSPRTLDSLVSVHFIRDRATLRLYITRVMACIMQTALYRGALKAFIRNLRSVYELHALRAAFRRQFRFPVKRS